MMRTIVLGAFALIAGFWSWYFYDRSTGHERELKERDIEITRLSGEITAKDTVIAEQVGTIEEQAEDIAEKAKEIRRLEVSMHLLKVEHRIGRLEVVSQEPDPDHPGGMLTTVRFVELDPQGKPIGEPVEATLKGTQVYIDSLVIKFEDDFVEAGDYLRGTSVCLFKGIFTDVVSPSEGQVIDPKNAHPLPYGGDDLPDPFYSDLWESFWEYANDPEAAAAKGVRAMQGEAPSIETKPGKVYRVELRQSDGLTITPEN